MIGDAKNTHEELKRAIEFGPPNETTTENFPRIMHNLYDRAAYHQALEQSGSDSTQAQIFSHRSLRKGDLPALAIIRQALSEHNK